METSKSLARIILVGAMLLSTQAIAKKAKSTKNKGGMARAVRTSGAVRTTRTVKAVKTRGQLCGHGTAVTTVYNLPKEDDPSTWKGFATFKDAVKMQGSGLRNNGKITTSSGKEVMPPSSCKTTTTSRSGACMLPYFSIAADINSGFRMGDIIYMRELAGKEITLPSGRTIKHPGYLIVHDTGGAIKGNGRFDLFIGSSSTEKSEFKKLNLKFDDKTECAGKKFEKIARGSTQYKVALAKIYDNQDADNGFQPRQTSEIDAGAVAALMRGEVYL